MPTRKHGVKSERRKHKRYSVDIQVEITTDSGRAIGVMIGTSMEGLRIRTNKLIEPGTDVVVTFSIGKRVKLLARVVWVLDKVKRGLSSYLAGLKIDSISINDKELQGVAENQAFLQNLLG